MIKLRDTQGVLHVYPGLYQTRVMAMSTVQLWLSLLLSLLHSGLTVEGPGEEDMAVANRAGSSPYNPGLDLDPENSR